MGKKHHQSFYQKSQFLIKKQNPFLEYFKEGKIVPIKKGNNLIYFRKLDSIKKFSQSPIEEEPQSPTFRTPETPGLKRSITFGDPK